MILLPLHQEIVSYLKERRLSSQFQKQVKIFLANYKHPGLNVELLEPKHLKLFSFRVNRRFRAIFIYRGPGVVEIIDVNNHYQ